MPTVTYRGRRRGVANKGALGLWLWGKPRTVTSEWLEAHRATFMSHSDWLVEGHEWAETTVDAGNDGIPDAGWSKGDIMAWMEENDLDYGALSTKKKMLDAIDAHLNPQEEEAPEEETTE